MNEVLNQMKEWFSAYVLDHELSDAVHQEMITMKYQHTHRVCDNVLALGKHLQLTDHSLAIAEIIALFHDIGRFDQYKRYKTFSDIESVNHAHWGIKILEEEEILSTLNTEDVNLVRSAILHHNAYTIPDALPDEEIFFIQLIRDADKLDIMHVIIESLQNPESRNPALSLDLPDENKISGAVVESVMNEVLVLVGDMETVHDYKILLLGWVYDINFSYTLEEMVKRSYFEDLIAMLPQTEDVKRIEEKIFNFIDKRISLAEML